MDSLSAVPRSRQRLGFLRCLPIVSLSLTIFAVLSLGFSNASAEVTMATVVTDKSLYELGDTVVLYGSGYGSGEVVTVEIQNDDGSVYDQWTVTASSDGTFETTWPLAADPYSDDVLSVEAEGSPSGLQAMATFESLAPAVSLEQMRNGSAGSPASPINWVNGNAGPSNAHLNEKWSQAYRAVFTDLALGDSVEFVVGYDITHSGKHAIDYLTYYDRINDPTHSALYGHGQETIDPLDGLGAIPGPVYAAIPAPPASSCTLVVPNPPGPLQSQPCTSFDELDDDPTQVRMTLYGGSFAGGSPISYDAGGDPTQASSEARVRVIFKADGSDVVLLWGGHLASNEDWGAGNSAGGISGSPYHMRLIELKVNGTLRNIGNQDRSLSAGAVSPCEITLTCPPDDTVLCGESTDTSNTGVATFTANAECGTVTLTYSDQTSGLCPVVIERTWVVSGSGNVDSCVQLITIMDTTKPALVGCPSNVTVQCNAIPAPATVTATDNCDSSVVPVYSEVSNLNGCGGLTGTIVRKWVATDDCGNSDSCMQTITVVDTSAPVCNIPAGPFNYFQCAPTQVSIPVSATDNCDASVTCAVISGPGAVSGGNWVYTPAGDETVNVTIRCTDDCGSFCEGSFSVTFVINDAPVCASVSDTTYFQCSPVEVCRPFSSSDANGNLDGCAITSGPGSLSGGNWCYTPSGDETVNVTIRCEDSCGAFCEESFSVTFVVNDPPVIDLGDDISLPQTIPQDTICFNYTVSDPNGLAGLVESLLTAPAGTVIDTANNEICFLPPGTGNFEFIVQVTDPCGEVDVDTIFVLIAATTPPVCNIPGDTSVLQCTPTELCLPVSATGLHGPVTCAITSGPGTLSGGQWCYTPVADGPVSVTITCTDTLGVTCSGSFTVTFDINDAPVCSPINDTTIFQCVPTEVCRAVSASDVNGNFDSCALVAGPGSISGGNWCYTPSGDETVNVTIRCTDDCGAFCEESFSVTFVINEAPVCSPVSDTTYFQCVATEVCRPVGATDADGNLTGCVIVSGPGSLSGGNWCYTPSGDETVNVTIRCTDDCGAFCEESFSVTFVVNDPPVCGSIDDTTIFQCAVTEVCLPFTSSDPNGNLIGCTITNGPGALSGGNWCYTPSGDETVNVTIRCTDDCGAFCEESFSVTFVINEAPVCSPVSDTTYFQCVAAEVCRPVGATDADGNLTGCVIVSGPGSLSGGNWCYTPSGDETVNVTIRCTDDCGAFCEESFSVTFVINEAPVCSPVSDTTYFQCVAAEVCRPVGATDADGNLTGCVIVSGPGSLSGGNWCYTPSGDETVNVTIRCTDDCGAFCEESFSVTFVINEAPVCSPVSDTTYFQCVAAEVCRPVGATDADGNLTGCVIVSGPGSLSGGNWCYTPSGDETVNVTIRCTDDCGAFCEESFSVTFEINEAPDCAVLSDTTIFQCAPMEVCRPFSSTDADGNLTGCVITSGPGTLSGGNWCYTPSGSETVNVTIRCTDDCGAFCEESFSVTFAIGAPPMISCAPDASYECDTEVPACSPSDVTVMGGAGTVTVTCSSSDNGGAGCAASPLIYTYVYTATDSCGAQAQCTRTLTVIDATAPVLSGCPADITISCDDPVPPPAAVTATDNCDGVVAPNLVETPNLNGCGGYTGTITRVWSAADACGNLATCTQIITIADSEDPVCSIPSGPFDYFQCTPTEISVPVSATDNCDPSVTCAVISGPGAISGGQWTYTPAGDESFAVTIRCTDDCGNDCEGSFNVNIEVNDPPAIAFGSDLNVFQCTLAEICLPYSVSDPNGLTGSSESLVSGPPGTALNAALDQVCFTPAGPGAYQIIVSVTDSCGASDQDTINVNVSLNGPPTITLGSDLSVVLCAPEEICIDYTTFDPDGNALTETLLSGPNGTVLNQAINRVCFTPASSGVYTIIVRVQDTCATSDVDTVNVTVSLNLPPIAIGPNDTSYFQCVAAQVCRPVGGSDPEGKPITISLVSGPGSINAGQWCYTPAGDGVVNVTFRVTDSCGAFDDDNFSVIFDINGAPSCPILSDTSVTMPCSLRTITRTIVSSDPDGNLSGCEVVSGFGTVSGGVWSFTPPSAGMYCTTIRCTDACGAYCEETFCVTVQVDDEDCDCLFKVSVNEGTSVEGLNGQIVTVPVKLDLVGVPIGGFDLLLCYDASAISLIDVDKGSAIEAWEYFTYRFGANGNCAGSCPSGLVRLVGITDLNNGIPVGDPNAFMPVGVLADLRFHVTADRNFINQCIPIGFCWFDCADNTIAGQSGDSTYLEIGFVFDTCQSNPKGDPIPAICFEPGRICIMEPPDDRGDINLNGIANEVGDAVLLTNYFIYGSAVWDPTWMEVQILATDVNDDGIVLTVADLIYLIRIITGDEQPFPPGTGTGSPKLSPFANSGTADLRVHDTRATVTTTSSVDIGAALMVFRYHGLVVGAPTLLAGGEGMTIRSNAADGELRILIHPSWEGDWATIGAGASEILSIPISGNGSFELTEVQMSDARGALLSTSTAKGSVPTEYELLQNYPNPFNAGTIITFNLKEASDWSVTVYNVIGQVVRTLDGRSDASNVRVSWDGRDQNGAAVASGVYFYRVQTPDWNATRKMTLVR